MVQRPTYDIEEANLGQVRFASKVIKAKLRNFRSMKAEVQM